MEKFSFTKWLKEIKHMSYRSFQFKPSSVRTSLRQEYTKYLKEI